MSFLNEIVENRKKSIKDIIKNYGKAKMIPKKTDLFYNSIKNNKSVSIISEVKFASPSMGDIKEKIPVKQIINAMELGGYQNSLIDDNGNGTPNEKEDGQLARDYNIGNGIVTASSLPIINSVMPETTITGSSTTLWADDIVSDATIARVWAHIKSPSTVSEDTEIPVTQLPKVDLTDEDGDGRYEGTYNGFTETGTYSVVIYASSTDGINTITSLPVETKVVRQ